MIIHLRGPRFSGKNTLACSTVTESKKYPYARIISAHEILKKVEDPALASSTIVSSISSCFDDALTKTTSLSAVIIDDVDVLLGASNDETVWILLEHIASSPCTKKEQKLAVILSSTRSGSSSNTNSSSRRDNSKIDVFLRERFDNGFLEVDL